MVLTSVKGVDAIVKRFILIMLMLVMATALLGCSRSQKAAETDGKDYLEQAVQAAERMKKNLTRYVTIL